MPIRLHTVATEQGMAVIFEEHTDDLDNFMVIHPGTVRRPDPVMYMTNSPEDVTNQQQIKTIDGETFSFKRLLRPGVVNFDDVLMLGLIGSMDNNEVTAKVYGTREGRRVILSALVATSNDPWGHPRVSRPTFIDLDLFDRGLVTSTYERNAKREIEEDRYDLIVKLPYGKPLFRRTRPVTAPADSPAS